MKRLAFLLVLALCPHARAEDDIGEFVAAIPPELENFDASRAAARRDVVSRALVHTKDKLARAVLILETADSYAAETSAEYIYVKDDAHYAAFVRASNRAVATYNSLFCDPGQPERDALICPADPALAHWRRTPELLHRYAFLLALLRQDERAYVVDQRLVDTYPDSPYASDARIALGDRAAGNATDDVATAQYEAILASNAPAGQRGYAAYRLGWVEMRQHRPRDAFAHFALAKSLAPGAALSSSALHQLVRAYSEYGQPEGAFDLFHAIAPGHEVELLDHLAQMWAADAVPANAVLSELVRRAPTDARRCEWQTQVARNFVDRDELGAPMLAAVEKLVEVFEQTRMIATDDVVETCAAATRDLTLMIARRLEGGVKNAEIRILIRRLDALFVRAFPTRGK